MTAKKNMTFGKDNRRKSEKGELRRRQIIKEARRSFLKNGYEGLSMRQVATQCDMNLKNLQYYFSTKEDLFIGITEEYYAETLNAMKLSNSKTRDSSKKLVELEKIIFAKWDAKSSAIWTQLYSMAHHSKKMRALKVEIYESWCAEMANLLHNYYPNTTEQKLFKVARILTALIDGVVFARTQGSSNLATFDALEKDIYEVSKMVVKTEIG